MATDARAWLAALAVVAGCGRTSLAPGSEPSGFICGPGTHAADNQCVADGATSPPADAGARDGGAPLVDAGASNADGGVAADFAVPLSPSGSVVTFQIDPAHSGGQPSSALRPPLLRRWSVTLDSTYLSYPLIVDGRVFVTGNGPNDARVYALSATTGTSLWGPVIVTTPARGAFAAWENGTLFVVDGSGTVQSIDASNGARGWSHVLMAGATAGPVAPPVAAGGIVYVAQNQTLFALDERNGKVLWHTGLAGDTTSVAWTPNVVVLDYILGAVSGLGPTDGAQLWYHGCNCSGGGGGNVPVAYDGRVYIADATLTGEKAYYRLSDGAALGSYVSTTLPAFENGLGFFQAGSNVEAHNGNGTVWWTFAGDGQLDSTPIAAGGFVYVGSTLGHLYALDEVTGRQVWSDTLSAEIAPSDYNDGSYRTTGLAASADLLVVPAGSTLTAYGN